MRLDKLTVKAQEAVQAAQSLADQHDHQAIEPEHLLLALLQQQEGVVSPLLAKLGARPETVSAQVQAEVAKLPKVQGGGRSYATPRFEGVINRAWDEAQRLKDEYVSTEHLLIAIAQEKTGGATRVLAANGVTPEAIYRSLVEVRGTQRVTDQNPEEKYQALQRYSKDLTERRAQGQARSGDRPRRGDPPRDPGALPPHQEQPRADRRARRRQDRDRRGPGPAHRGRATCPRG